MYFDFWGLTTLIIFLIKQVHALPWHPKMSQKAIIKMRWSTGCFWLRQGKINLTITVQWYKRRSLHECHLWYPNKYSIHIFKLIKLVFWLYHLISYTIKLKSRCQKEWVEEETKRQVNSYVNIVFYSPPPPANMATEKDIFTVLLVRLMGRI